MKAFILLAGLLPVALHANALQQEPAKVPKVAAKTEMRPAKQRWENAAKSEEPSFRRHVIPLMSRAGCSGRECHGSFQGRGGFQLSLFGYDFEKDHEAITKGKGGAEEIRVDLKDPAKSLIVAKPSLDNEEHKGKKRFDKGSWEYNLLLRWVQEGAKSDVAETGDFGKLEVLPKELVFKKTGDAIQLKVLAHWKDGTVEDVTQLTRFRTNDESVALVNDTGLVTSKEIGDTHIVAFYDNGVEPVPAILPFSDKSVAKLPAVKSRTKVDELVNAKLTKAGIVPSEVCTDLEFLRRASLDVTGTLPLPSEIEAFAKDTAPDRRARKIDELLTRPAYAAWWATKISDFSGNNPRLIRAGAGNNGRNLSGEMSRQWYSWIYKRLADNTPYDQMAAGMVLAVSRTAPKQSYKDFVCEMGSYFKKENPADFAQRPNLPWFWMRQNLQKPEEKALAFAHTFLGVRIECAQCHKHPFDQWTKTDFEQFQAFFSGISGGYKGGKGPVTTATAGAPEEMTADSLRKEIKDKAMATLGAKPVDPDPKKKNNEAQKAEQNEVTRRIAAGEPVPWDELFVDLKRMGQPMSEGKKRVEGGSRVITPKILGGEKVMVENYSDPRAPLMEWMRSRENPYFAKAFVNRVWASYFSRGIVEPADDLNLANAPSNAALLGYLAEGFISHGFDIKWLHREILASDAYQRSWKPNATNRLDEKNFSHAVIRRLPAEVVYDAIATATASSSAAGKVVSEIDERAIGPNASGAYGNGKRGGGDNYALAIFGKPVRETNCDCERTTDPTLLQTIYTRNDPSLLQRVEGGKSAWIDELRIAASPRGERNPTAMRENLARMEEKFTSKNPAPVKPATDDAEAVAKFEQAKREYDARVADLKARKADMQREIAEAEKPIVPFNLDKAINDVFLRTVSRPPTVEEFAQAKTDVGSAKLPVDGVRDLLWAMLNTREFMVNH